MWLRPLLSVALSGVLVAAVVAFGGLSGVTNSVTQNHLDPFVAADASYPGHQVVSVDSITPSTVSNGVTYTNSTPAFSGKCDGYPFDFPSPVTLTIVNTVTLATQTLQVTCTPDGTLNTTSTYPATSASSLSDGSYTVTATQQPGNLTSGVVPFTVDTTPPTGSVTAPVANATLSGVASVLTATASDATAGVASVQFKEKPTAGSFTNVGLPITSSPYTTSWDTTTVANGTYVLEALVTDRAGNTFITSTVNVTVSNNYSFAVGTIVTQTAGSPFGNFTIQLQVNGTTAASNYNGVAYSGFKAITFSGTATTTSPNGNVATGLTQSLNFTNGLATVPASTITLFKAQIGATLTATDSNSVSGTSGGFTVNAATAAKIAFVNCSNPSAANTTCSGSPIIIGNNSSMTFSIQTQDSFGNPAPAPSTVTLTFPTSPAGNYTVSGTPFQITSGQTTSAQFTVAPVGNNEPTTSITAHLTSAQGYADVSISVKK